MADLNSEVENHFNNLSRTTDVFRETMINATNAVKAADEAEKKRKTALEKQFREISAATTEVTNVLTSGLTSTAKSVAGANGSFSTLNHAVDLSSKAFGSLLSIVPLVGGALKGLAEGAGEATKLMIEQFQIGWNAYKDLADVGLTQNFKDLKETGQALGLRYEDIAKALKDDTHELLLFGSTTSDSVRQLKQLGIASADSRNTFRRLGISADEYVKFQAQFMAQEARLGRQQIKDADTLNQKTDQYILELTQLTDVTGTSRKALQKARNDALREDRFRAALDQQGGNLQALDLSVILKERIGDSAQKGFQDLFATAGVPVTEESKQFVLQNKNARKVVDLLNAKQIDKFEAFNLLLEGSNLESRRNLTRFTGNTNIFTRDYAKWSDALLKGPISAKKLEEEKEKRKKTLTGEEKLTAALADTEGKLYDMGRDLQDVSTSSTLVTSAMELMADGMDAFTEKLFEVSGQDLPEYLKARKAERELIKKNNEGKQEEIEAREYLKQYEGKESITNAFQRAAGEAKLARAQQKQAEFRAGIGAATSRRLSSKNSELARTSNVDLSQIEAAGLADVIKSPEAVAGGRANDALISVAQQIKSGLGPGLRYFSAFNDRYHQGLDRYSAHQEGNALDFTLTNPKDAKAAAELVKKIPGVTKVIDEYSKLGPNATGGHIHAEVAARRFGGTVADGRSYLVGENGPEVMDPGAGVVLPNAATFGELFAMMSAKLDKMADALEHGNNTRKKILQHTQNS